MSLVDLLNMPRVADPLSSELLRTEPVIDLRGFTRQVTGSYA